MSKELGGPYIDVPVHVTTFLQMLFMYNWTRYNVAEFLREMSRSVSAKVC